MLADDGRQTTIGTVSDTVKSEMSTTYGSPTGLTAARRLPPDRRTMRGSAARAVGSFVPKLTTKVFERFGFHSAEILTNWPRVAGEDIAMISQPERIRWPRGTRHGEDGDGGAATATLILRVDPAHALDIEYRGGDIIDRINRYFGYRAVSGLKILQAPLVARAAPPVAAAHAVAVAAVAAPGAKPDDGGDDPLAAALGRLSANVSQWRQRQP